MIKTQIIKQEGKPIAVVLDYKAYIKLKGQVQDLKDYSEAVNAEKETKKLTSLAAVKRKLKL